MKYSYRFRAHPTQTGVGEACESHIDLHRQLYNHVLYDYDRAPADGEKPGQYDQNRKLPGWKDQWSVFQDLNHTAMQATVRRFHHNLHRLHDLKDQGYSVGQLKWKSPTEYRSITYVGKSFDLDKKRGNPDTSYVRLSKIGWIPFRHHRPFPDAADVNEVTLKQERTGEWYVSFDLTLDDEQLPKKPDVEELDTDDCVGVDLGIRNYIHTSDGLSVGKLDLEREYDRLRKAQHTLSRRDEGSENWEKARQRVAAAKRKIRRKVLDFQHKLTTWLCREHDAVFVEDLDVQTMLEEPGNARNKQDAAWRQFIQLLEYKAELYGCHVAQVPAPGTTKECARCGVEVEKELWIRDHSCPSCGFETDRDWNAALNILQRGLERLGVGCAEARTPVETAAAVGTEAHANDVPARRVIETGTPAREEGRSPAPPRAG